MTRGVAVELVRDFPEELIRAKVEQGDWLREEGTFSMAADTRGQFHEWSKEQYVVRNSRCPLKLLPNNAPTLTRELSALSTSQTSRNEKVPGFRSSGFALLIGSDPHARR